MVHACPCYNQPFRPQRPPRDNHHPPEPIGYVAHTHTRIDARTHLLGDTAPAEVVESVELVRLAQQRIEGLAGALRQVSVRRHREGGHVRQLLARVLA